MRRRDIIRLIGGAVAAGPIAARGQQPAVPAIGLLDAGFAVDRIHAVAAFRQGLANAGYAEGRNVEFEFRWADDQLDRLPALAGDLIDRRVVLIAAFGNAAALAAKTATSSIPVVFSSSSDPVAIGLITNLIQPGGNMTGVTILNQELESTRLERLIQIAPRATTIAFLVNPDSLTTTAKMREMDGAARAFGRRLQVLEARSRREFEGVFTSMEQQRIEAVVVASDTAFSNASGELGHVSTLHAIPVVGAYRPFVEAGGLMSYGTDLADSYRRVGGCAARILKGEHPGDLPVQESTRVEFVINSRTANRLSLQIPASLRAIADELIE